MEKKYFEIPYIKVIAIKNDILTNSIGVTDDDDDFNKPGMVGAQGRNNFFEDDEF